MWCFGDIVANARLFARFGEFFHLKMELVAWVIESSNDTSVRSMRNKTWWHCTLIGMPEHFDWGRCYGVTVFSMFGWQYDSRWSCAFLKKNFRFCEKAASVLKKINFFPSSHRKSTKKKAKLLLSIPDKFEFLLWFWHTPSFGKSFPIGNFQFLPMTSLITNRKSPKNLGW